MQLAQQKGNIVEKILRDAQGQLVRATFCVYEQNGRVKARLISAQIISEPKAIAGKTLCLNGSTVAHTIFNKTVFTGATVSPYFNTSLLHTLGSKPRAPTF